MRACRQTHKMRMRSKNAQGGKRGTNQSFTKRQPTSKISFQISIGALLNPCIGASVHWCIDVSVHCCIGASLIHPCRLLGLPSQKCILHTLEGSVTFFSVKERPLSHRICIFCFLRNWCRETLLRELFFLPQTMQEQPIAVDNTQHRHTERIGNEV